MACEAEQAAYDAACLNTIQKQIAKAAAEAAFNAAVAAQVAAGQALQACLQGGGGESQEMPAAGRGRRA